MLGDTSSYLSGDDTSKLVTPSEACCGKQTIDNVRPAVNSPESPPPGPLHSCVLTKWRGDGEVLSPWKEML